jgi:Arc/MetJ family transcription regulator
VCIQPAIVYTHVVKRLQILIEEDLDAALEKMAGQQGTSKGALVRRFVREKLAPGGTAERNPLWEMAGADDFEPTDVDLTVYG